MFIIKTVSRISLQQFSKIKIVKHQPIKCYSSCLSAIHSSKYKLKVKHAKWKYDVNLSRNCSQSAPLIKTVDENIQTLTTKLHLAIFSSRKLNYTLIGAILDKIENSEEEIKNVSQAMLVFECLCHLKQYPDSWQGVLRKVYKSYKDNVDQLTINQICDFSIFVRNVSIENIAKCYDPILFDCLANRVIKENMNLSSASTLLVTIKIFDHRNIPLFEHVCDRFLFRASRKMLSSNRMIGFFMLIVGTIDRMDHVPSTWKEIIKYVDLRQVVSQINDSSILTALLVELAKEESEHSVIIRKIINRLRLYQDDYTVSHAIKTFKILRSLKTLPDGWENLLQVLYNVLMNYPDQISQDDLEFLISIMTGDSHREMKLFNEQFMEVLKLELLRRSKRN